MRSKSCWAASSARAVASLRFITSGVSVPLPVNLLSGARQVDFDEHGMTCRCGGPNRFGGCPGPVQPAVNLGPLEELPVVDQLLEALGRDERIVDAVDLTGTRGPCG